MERFAPPCVDVYSPCLPANNYPALSACPPPVLKCGEDLGVVIQWTISFIPTQFICYYKHASSVCGEGIRKFYGSVLRREKRSGISPSWESPPKVTETAALAAKNAEMAVCLPHAQSTIRANPCPPTDLTAIAVHNPGWRWGNLSCFCPSNILKDVVWILWM